VAVRAPDRRFASPLDRRVEHGRRAHPAGRPARPRLRVVPPNSLSPAARRRRTRLLVVVLFASVVVGLLAVVALHALLSQNQLRLDQIDARAASEQTRYERLRLEVAQLESPGRIVATAQQKLGMVTPPVVTYLAPSGAADDQPRTVPGALMAAPPRPGTAATTSNTWATVKPYLADHP
jgi:cell division protein FtsL